MLSDEEKKEYEELKSLLYTGTLSQYGKRKLIEIIEKQSKEIEEMKKQIDLDNECEIALNNRIMDLEKEIEELKENNKILKNLQNDTSRLYIEMIERKNYFERKLEKLEDKIKAKIEEYKKQLEKMEKDDVGIGFTLGKEWSDLKAKVEFGQSLLEKESICGKLL